MPPLDNLYQYLVPLAFVAIWALTSLFNRESQPLPPRTLRPPGPRPVPQSPPVRPAERRPESPLREPLTLRPSSAGGSRPGSRPGDDILIIEAEPRRTSGPSPSRPGAAAARRAPKARPTRQAETPTPRALSASMTHPQSPPTIQSQALKPLSLPPSPLLTTPNDEAAKTQADRALVSQLDSFSSAEIRRLVQTPARLREGFIIGELLKPPLALRDRSLTNRRRPHAS